MLAHLKRDQLQLWLDWSCSLSIYIRYTGAFTQSFTFIDLVIKSFKPCSHVTEFSLIFQPEIPTDILIKLVLLENRISVWIGDGPFAPKFYSLIQNNFDENFGLNIFTCEQCF